MLMFKYNSKLFDRKIKQIINDYGHEALAV